jgi:hypothetical protein
MSDTYSTVRQALEDQNQIVATYKGLVREMCPHAIGTKDGREQAIFFQFAGESSKGLPDGGEWRCLAIDGLSDVSVRSGEWHTGTSHSQPNTCIDEVDVEVAH